MEPIGWLLVMCIAMFLGAYVAGLVPLSVSMSAARLRYITIFGAGLLVGTALIVIIPEGVAMHYEAQLKHGPAAPAALSLPPGVIVDAHTHAHANTHGHRRLLDLAGGEALIPEAEPGGALSPEAAAALQSNGEQAAGEVEEDITHSHPGHWQIGAALAVGFAFQLLVDRLSGGLHGHSHGTAVPGGTSGATAPSVSSTTAVDGGNSAFNVRANAGGDHSAKSKSAMAGLVVHAAVDGVALGAAVREGDSALGMLVFLAIMLHKAPSSFGLASYLLHHGISYEGVRKRLVIFSSAAPLGAILTYSLLSINVLSYKQEMLALCLLFSGGTFLYVATSHVLPEIQHGDFHDEEDDELDEHGHSHGNRPRTQPKMKWSEVWTLVAGVLLPLLIDVHHGH